jgi:hypothetical protein
MAALDSANYSKFNIITKNDRGIEQSIDISSSVVEFRYYEDLYSPILTATATIMATGNVQIDKNGSNRTTLISGVPLKGGEDIEILMTHENSIGGLELQSAKLFINRISNISSNNNRESFTLHMISKSAVTDNVNRVEKVLRNKTATGHVLDILDKNLNIISNINNVEPSVGNITYKGNGKKPFTVIFSLASKAIPESTVSNSAGFVFYETQNGLNFRSIDGLIKEEIVANYKEINAILSTYDPKGTDPREKILAKNVIENNDLLENLQFGVFSSKRTFFDPHTGSIAEINLDYGPEDYRDKMNNLGNGTVNSALDGDFLKPSRNFVGVVKRGSIDYTDKSLEEQLENIISQTTMRYNTILNQVINIIVPMNLDLTVGNLILCDFPKTGSSEIDAEISGKYLIKELCHYSSAESAYTSLQIVRDTYGRKQ